MSSEQTAANYKFRLTSIARETYPFQVPQVGLLLFVANAANEVGWNTEYKLEPESHVVITTPDGIYEARLFSRESIGFGSAASFRIQTNLLVVLKGQPENTFGQNPLLTVSTIKISVHDNHLPHHLNLDIRGRRGDPVSQVLLTKVMSQLYQQSAETARLGQRVVLNNCPLCPNCGEVAKCTHTDVGASSYHDIYRLNCVACGHAEEEEIYGGQVGWGGEPTYCPYCLPYNPDLGY